MKPGLDRGWSRSVTRVATASAPLALLSLAACLRARWPSTPATDAPTRSLAVDERRWFATSPFDAGTPEAGAPPATLRIVAGKSCSDRCGAIDLLRGDARVGALLTKDALSAPLAVPDWAQPPVRIQDGGAHAWTREIVVPVVVGDRLSLRGQACRARFFDGADLLVVRVDSLEHSVEVSCD